VATKLEKKDALREKEEVFKRNEKKLKKKRNFFVAKFVFF